MFYPIGMGALSAFVSGAVVTCFFHGPELSKKGFIVLARGGLQGVALTIASLALSAGLALNVKTDENQMRNGFITLFGTYILCVITITATAKNWPHRLGTPMEVLASVVTSSVLGALTSYYCFD